MTTVTPELESHLDPHVDMGMVPMSVEGLLHRGVLKDSCRSVTVLPVPSTLQRILGRGRIHCGVHGGLYTL